MKDAEEYQKRHTSRWVTSILILIQAKLIDLASSSNSTVFAEPPILSLTEVRHLRRVVDHIPLRLWAVALIGFWERFTFWGLTAPWQNYMENELDSRNGIPGALGLGQAQATRIYCAFYIFYYISPLVFAILSDTRLGRYKTLCITTIVYVLGCAAVTATSFDRPLRAGLGLPGLLIGMLLVGLGGGGFKMLMVPFLADQYANDHPKMKTLKSGEQVITDRSLTLQYIFNLYYWVGNVGSLSWFATTIIERYVSFALAYMITLVSMVLATVVLFLGARWYIQVPPGGNILPTASRIIICASRNGFNMKRADPSYQLEHRGKSVPWSGQSVDELRRGLMACRVLLPFVMFYVCFDQMQNNLVSQAKQMQSGGIPNDMIPALNGIACIILGPIIQYLLYPFLYQRRIHFRPVARITTGFAFMALGMLYTAVLQHFIYSAGPCYSKPLACPHLWDTVKETPDGFSGQQGNYVNIWWQTPVYFFIGAGEIFALVTSLEYAQEHAPDGMKAIVQAISLVLAGFGSVFAMALTPIAHDPYLVALYSSIAVAMTVTTVIFWWLFHGYDEEEILKDNEAFGLDGTTDARKDEPGRQLDESILRSGPRPLSQNSMVTVTTYQELDAMRPQPVATGNMDNHGIRPLTPVREFSLQGGS
ncbi:PTR2-domain-containing protein [Lophiostoma macrostomum CBS 122681]|uniref:PTR2-domain-containing protein n=1 Tax=Lophiostoma macrostomum CBS 122681 TaxID=1314788 RepID=A0A6A6SV73_9PLEO|nr:PTR2-domain-containing protein [Lophiostoma macrostomum CBS 122681]